MFDYNAPSIILEMITANNTVVMFLCRKMYKKKTENRTNSGEQNYMISLHQPNGC